MKYCFVILFLTQVYFTVAFFSNRKHDQTVRKSRDFDDSIEQSDVKADTQNESECGGECGCLICNSTLPNPKKIINPYREQLSNRLPPKPFGSFCVKCAACLSVANEIQQTIESASQECETDLEKKKIILVEIEKRITSLCDRGFKNFDLRSYGNHGIITNNFQCTTHIESAMDGSWTKKLREICKLFVSRIDVEEISQTVLDSTGNLTDTFCRGNGIFRDCANIKSHENITMPPCQNCGH